MAAAAVPLLAEKPKIDLLDTISAHDLGSSRRWGLRSRPATWLTSCGGGRPGPSRGRGRRRRSPCRSRGCPAQVIRSACPATFERGVGDVGETVLEAEVVELARAPDRQPEALGPADGVDVPGDPLAPRARGRRERRRSRRRAGPWPAAASRRGRCAPGSARSAGAGGCPRSWRPRSTAAARPSTTSAMCPVSGGKSSSSTSSTISTSGGNPTSAAASSTSAAISADVVVDERERIRA